MNIKQVVDDKTVFNAECVSFIWFIVFSSSKKSLAVAANDREQNMVDRKNECQER